jgi:hypothetical protein
MKMHGEYKVKFTTFQCFILVASASGSHCVEAWLKFLVHIAMTTEMTVFFYVTPYVMVNVY